MTDEKIGRTMIEYELWFTKTHQRIINPKQTNKPHTHAYKKVQIYRL